MTGTVTDSTGAVIPNAKVTITNLNTSTKTRLITSTAGTYTSVGLIPGTYSLTVEAPGFQKYVQTGIHIETATTATINATMTAGAATQTIQVTSSPIALNTTQPQIGTVIEPAVVASLPFEVSGRGRQIDQVQFLAPGVSGGTFSHRVDGGVDFEQEILFNGIPAPQPETQGYITNFDPPFEMVQEVKVERTTFSAQYGLGQGAQNFQMASGTNKFHGDLFEINRNSMFDSVGFFNSKAQGGNGRVPTDHENNYGFTIAGPVLIPKVYNGRDKTFFHYSQEWYKQNAENTNTGTVPSALENGSASQGAEYNFSDFVDGSGNQIPIYVPPGVSCGGLSAGQQFPGNIIPAACVSPNSQILLKYLPNPDRPGTGVGGLNGNKNYVPFNNPTIQHEWGYTIDQVITPSQSIHWAEWRNTLHNYGFDYAPIVLPPNPLNSQKYYPYIGTGFLLNYDYTISPRMILTLGAGWIGEINNQFNQSKYSFAAVQGGIIPPNITFDGQHAPTSWGTSGAWLQSINRKLGVSMVGNLLWTKGRNTFNIGAEVRRALQDDNEEQTAGGHFAFSQIQTADPSALGTTGSSFASFLLGLPNSTNRSNSQELKLRNFDMSPYIQDDIKMTPKLTVNLGMRWDIMVPFTEMHNNIVYFDPTIANPAANGIPGAMTKFGNCTGCAGFNRAPIDWHHFGPRLGFAYQINNKTVVQGGFSIAFLDGGAYEYGTNKVAVNYGNLLLGSYAVNSSGSNRSNPGSWDTNILPNPPATPFNPSLGVGGPQVDAFSKRDNYAPYSQQWSVNIQRELPYQMFLTAAWVGNRDIHLPSQLNSINQINPKYFSYGNDLNLSFADGSAQAAGYTAPYANFASMWGSSATLAQALVPFPQYGYIFDNFEGKGTAYYQSMQLQLEKRFTNGLAFLASYTLAREYNNTSSGFTSFIANSLNKYNQKLEWSPTTGEAPQMLKVSGTYELPIGPGKRFFSNHGITGQALGGWQVGWIMDYESGGANGVYQNLSFPYPNGGGQRPNRVSSVSLGTASYNLEHDYFLGKGVTPQIYNPAAWSAAPDYTLGNAYRSYSALRNPAYYMEDANLRKHFYFGDRFQGILQVDYFNLFNRTQFNGPDTNVSDVGNFGLAEYPGSNISNRQGQVQFRLQF